MATELTKEEQAALDAQAGTSIDAPKKSKNSGNNKTKKKKATVSTVSGDMSEKELRTGWHYLFKIVSMVRRSKTEFAEDEFTDLAKAYLNLANKYAPLKYAFLLLAPLATVGELIDKLRKVERGVEKKPKPPKPGAVDMHDIGGGVYGTHDAGSGFTAPQ